MLFLLGTHPCGALIDNIDDSFDANIFLDPVVWISVDRLQEVASALSRLDELKKDHYLLGWFRLSGHLARLAESAEYFGFPYDEEKVMKTLRACAASLGAGVFKVRLLLNDDGDVLAEAEEVSPVQEPVRVAFTNERTDPTDRFLFHKTTHRPLYLKAQQVARKCGLWDLLFRNKDGEVTEGSICNLFAKIDGTWCTPPQSSGLLAGVMRRELIPRLEAEVRPLRAEELFAAEDILVTNSVREVLRAELIDLPPVSLQDK